MRTSTKNADTVMVTSSNPPSILIPDWEESARPDQTLARLQLLWAKRAFLWRCTVIGLLGSALIAFLIPAGYTTTAQLMPPDPQSGAGLAVLAAITGDKNGGGGGLTSIASDLLGIKTSGSLFISVLRSRTVQDRIVDTFQLKKVYWKGTEAAARKKLGNNTDISEDRKSGVITIDVYDHDPKRAAAIANGYIDQLNVLMTELNTSAAHRERVFLEDRLRGVNGDLETSEKNFSQFASKNAAIDISAQGKAMVEGAAELQGELIAAQSELEGLRQIYSDHNVRVRSTQARISELRAQLAKLGGKYDENSASSDSNSSTENSYPTLRQLPILGVPYADKYRQLKVNEAIFETLTKEYELAKVQEAKELPSVKVLDPPEIPERRSWPPRMLIMIAGTLCTILVGGVWVVGEARWNELDRSAPGMVLLTEVVGTIRSKLPKVSGNGAGSNGAHAETGDPPSGAG